MKILVACVLAIGVAQAQTFPAKPVRIVVPFAAGGATDIVTRMLGQKLGERWGQTVVVENRGGAAGNLGAAEVARAPADGHVLLMTSGSIVTANRFIYKNMGFDPATDLAPITQVAGGPQVVVVNPAQPYRTLAELVAAAKARPGGLNYGHAGIGSQTHLAAEGLLFAAGIEVVHVPYKGEGPAVADLVGGQITFATPNMPAAIGHINAGKLRALAVTSAKRSDALPEVPAAAETLAGFDNLGWFGLMAPAGTPSATIATIAADTARVLDTTEMRARLFAQGMAPMAGSPERMRRVIASETERWKRVVEARRIAVN